jgi:hypothetical protein
MYMVPHKRLYAEIINRAFQDATGNTEEVIDRKKKPWAKRTEQRHALYWFLIDDFGGCTLRDCCEALEIDMKVIREGVREKLTLIGGLGL